MRYLHLIHRWLGIGLGLFVLLWFLSGLVMLFVSYPELTQSERIEKAAPIDLSMVKLSAQQAWLSLNVPSEPDQVRLGVLAGRPLYRFLHEDSWQAVWADDGSPTAVSPQLLHAVAGEWLAGSKPLAMDSIYQDQWSISSSLHAHRPLHRITLNNAADTQLYISSHTGEVVLDTSRTERAWNWLGSVIHWIYFTPLRAERELWRQLVLWLAFGGVVLAVLGLWLGIQRVRLRQPYKGKNITPYHGWKRWHHLAGLTAGAFCLTWLVSGWLSLTPFGWLSERALSLQEQQDWAGGKLVVHDMLLPPAVALGSAGIKEMEWLRFAGSTYVLGHANGRDWLLHAGDGQAVGPITTAQLQLQAVKLQPAANLFSTAWLPQGDLYYRAGRGRALWPAWRVDFSDEKQTSYYINPQTAQIVHSEDRHSRAYRWLFSGLHQLDVPPLTEHLQARRASVFALSVGGILLVMAGLVLAWRRIRR